MKSREEVEETKWMQANLTIAAIRGKTKKNFAFLKNYNLKF